MASAGVERLVPRKYGLVSTVTLEERGHLGRSVQMLHRLEASTTEFTSDELGDSGPNVGTQNVKKKVEKKQALRKPSLQQYWRDGNKIADVAYIFHENSPVKF